MQGSVTCPGPPGRQVAVLGQNPRLWPQTLSPQNSPCVCVCVLTLKNKMPVNLWHLETLLLIKREEMVAMGNLFSVLGPEAGTSPHPPPTLATFCKGAPPPPPGVMPAKHP